MRGEQYDGIADVQGAVYNEELFMRAEQRQDGSTFRREFYKDSEQIWSERTISYIWQGRRF